MSDTPFYALDPIHGFRFEVRFNEHALGTDTEGTARQICGGAFSEVSGLEATMEPVAIGEGGRNWGQAQRVGKTTFSTVILRRGVTTTRHLWKWFDTVARAGGYKHRMAVVVRMYGPEPAGDGERPYIEWKLERALPVKLKLADLDATGQEVAVEELHLVHEGIVETASTGGGS